MTNLAHLEARRLRQEAARLARVVRWFRKKGKLAEADARLLAFGTSRLLAVPSRRSRWLLGQWRELAPDAVSAAPPGRHVSRWRLAAVGTALLCIAAGAGVLL